MGAIASKGQLRMSFARWAVFAVPLLLVLGFLAGNAVPTGDRSAWYVALIKPPLTPPGWVFPAVWGVLYVLLGLSLALILNARGAQGRGTAITLFVLAFALNLAWTPVFFGAHAIPAAVLILLGILAIGIVTAVAFSRIRPLAAWLLVPYLAWIGFAAVLTWRTGALNPHAAEVAPVPRTSQML